jgi:hypothetical protein
MEEHVLFLPLSTAAIMDILGSSHVTGEGNISNENCREETEHSFCSTHFAIGASTSVVVKAPCYKPEGRGFETHCGECMFSVCLILPAALGPEVYSVSNRNEYQNQKNNVSGSRERPVCRADKLTAICEPTV